MKRLSLLLALMATRALMAMADDVDTRIPVSASANDKLFALVIANENYKHEVAVPFALNDGELFALYCEKAFGVPRKNIHHVADATLNDMKHELQWLKNVMTAYEGEARAVVYYSGHGMPDEKSRSAILLPVDGYATDPGSGMSTSSFYAELESMPSRGTVVFLDACFSGAKRDGGTLLNARGVAVRHKQDPVTGPLVVFSAAQGDETAYPYKEKQHGLFTYYVLEKLQQSGGAASLGELGDYVTKHVHQSSIVENGKPQQPQVTAGSNEWRDWQMVDRAASDFESRTAPSSVKTDAAAPAARQRVVISRDQTPAVSPAATAASRPGPAPADTGRRLDLGDYTIEGAGTGTQGSYLVTVTLVAKKPDVSDEQLCRCAVHGVLFQGFTGERQRQRPLAGEANEGQYYDYYTEFFSGNMKDYARPQSDSRTVSRVGKAYKVRLLVSVNKDRLRRDLEAAGVIKSLSNPF